MSAQSMGCTQIPMLNLPMSTMASSPVPNAKRVKLPCAVTVSVTDHVPRVSNFVLFYFLVTVQYHIIINLWIDSPLQSWTLIGSFQVPPVCYLERTY